MKGPLHEKWTGYKAAVVGLGVPRTTLIAMKVSFYSGALAYAKSTLATGNAHEDAIKTYIALKGELDDFDRLLQNPNITFDQIMEDDQ